MVGLMKYKRVAQRMRENFGLNEFKIEDLEDAIFIECGTDPRTVKAAINRMLRLKLILKVEQKRIFGVESTEKYKLQEGKDEYF